jgi:hypothetical protein
MFRARHCDREKRENEICDSRNQHREIAIFSKRTEFPIGTIAIMAIAGSVPNYGGKAAR